MVQNSFGGPLLEIVFSPEQSLQNRLIANLVVHIVTTVLYRKSRKILHPLVCMLLESEAESLKVKAIVIPSQQCLTEIITCLLKDMFLPVIPDGFVGITEKLGGTITGIQLVGVYYTLH